MDPTNQSGTATPSAQQQNSVPAHLDISKPFSDEANLAILVNALEKSPAYEETFQFRDDMDEERARRYMDWEVQELSQKVGGKYDIGYVIEKQDKGLNVSFHVREMGPEHHVPPPPPPGQQSAAQSNAADVASDDQLVPIETKPEKEAVSVQPNPPVGGGDVSVQEEPPVIQKAVVIDTAADEGQLQDVGYGDGYDMNGKPVAQENQAAKHADMSDSQNSTETQATASPTVPFDPNKPLAADENIAIILNALDTAKVFEQEILCGLNILTNEDTQKVITNELDQLYQKLSEKRSNIKSYTKVSTTIVGEDESTQKMRVRVKIAIDPTIFQEFMARTELENIQNTSQ